MIGHSYLGIFLARSSTHIIYWECMDKLFENQDARPSCAAARMTDEVDEAHNAAAKQEAADATDELWDFGADLGEGSAYFNLEDGTPSFTERSAACSLCKGVAQLFSEGFVQRASQCVVSGSCEMVWVQEHPEKYKDEDGRLTAKQVVCAAQLGCEALITLEVTPDGLVSSVSNGKCTVVEQGRKWQAIREEGLPKATLIDPEAGIQVWDGEGSGRESVS